MKPLLFVASLLSSVVLANAQTPLPPLPADNFVTLTQIVNEFSTQPDAALQKYQGQRILVYGIVGQVTQSDDMDGDPLTVFLQIPNNTTPDVKCVFPVADIPRNEQGNEVQISDDDREAVGAHRNREGNISWQRPIFTEGQNAGIRGTFDNFVAGDIVLKDCRKVLRRHLHEILQQNGITP